MNLPQNIHTNSYHRAAHSPCFVIMRCCGRRKNLSHAIALSCRSLCFPLVCCCMMMMSNENGNYWKQHQKPEINGIKFFFQLMLFLTMRRVEMPMKIQWMKSDGIFELFMIFLYDEKMSQHFGFSLKISTGLLADSRCRKMLLSFSKIKVEARKRLHIFLSRREKWKKGKNSEQMC